MRYHFFIVILLSVLIGCERQKEMSSMNPINWKKRSIELSEADSLTYGSSYLPVYSEIYERTEKLTYGLTVTVSLRNISLTDSIYILRADYYNTHGDLIRKYINWPIYVKPMETVEIVIDEVDKGGGTGANFIFDWAIKNPNLEPFFEAVMISTTGQQGISFTTQGINIHDDQ